MDATLISKLTSLGNSFVELSLAHRDAEGFDSGLERRAKHRKTAAGTVRENWMLPSEIEYFSSGRACIRAGMINFSVERSHIRGSAASIGNKRRRGRGNCQRHTSSRLVCTTNTRQYTPARVYYISSYPHVCSASMTNVSELTISR